jgi:hypothetical protein
MKPGACKLILFILFVFSRLLFVGNVNAQNVEDSLLNVAGTSADDSIVVHTYIALCDLKTYNDTKKAVEYAEKAIAIAEESKYYNGVAKGYERLGNAYFQLG